MMRKTNRKALYEVINSAGTKTNYEQLHPQGNPQGNPSGTAIFRWINKPKFVQVNAGRIEFSMPLQVCIAVFLGIVLIVVVTFRAGQWVGVRQARPAIMPIRQNEQPVKSVSKSIEPAAVKPAASKTALTGKNRIVIQMYQVRSHLEPVKEYFARLGVETEILVKNNWYYLVTKNKYDNIEKSGTDGYAAKQKIAELGSGYKAPPGYETFGIKPFSGAFGMKFDE